MFPPLRLRAALSLGGLSVRELAVRTWSKINENEIMTRAAAVAFYAMLALVPFLALVLTLAARLLPDLSGKAGEPGLGNLTVTELETTFKEFFPPEAYGIFADQIARLQTKPPIGLLSVGLAVTLWLASSLFLAVMDALNRIYGVRETRSLVKLRLIAFVMTMVQAVILVGSLVIIVVWPHFVSWIGWSAPTAALATLAQWVIVAVMVLLSFALAFYVGPDAEQRLEWITPGSLVGTVAFLLVSLLFRVYVQRFAHYDVTYGSLGGVMVLLFWFWLASLILLTAGQVNQLIEDASPLGKASGRKTDPTVPLDLAALPPEPAAARDPGQ